MELRRFPSRYAKHLPSQQRAQEGLEGDLSSSEHRTHAKAQTGMNQSLDHTSQVPTKMALHQFQVPVFWIPGSCSNCYCQVTAPQPTITGTHVEVQDADWHLSAPWCLRTGKCSLQGCCHHRAT